jgi:hypothetical protein
MLSSALGKGLLYLAIFSAGATFGLLVAALCMAGHRHGSAPEEALFPDPLEDDSAEDEDEGTEDEEAFD